MATEQKDPGRLAVKNLRQSTSTIGNRKAQETSERLASDPKGLWYWGQLK